MAAHPRDPETAWVIPLIGARQGPLHARRAGGRLADARRRDFWERLAAGLPQEHAYLGVLREAMAVDRLDPVGRLLRDEHGQLYGSADDGAQWRLVADVPAGVWSVEAVVVED